MPDWAGLKFCELHPLFVHSTITAYFAFVGGISSGTSIGIPDLG